MSKNDSKSKSMTVEAFKAALDALGFSTYAFADLVGTAPRTVSYWVAEGPVPVAETLTRLLVERPELVAVVRRIMDRPVKPAAHTGRPRKAGAEA